MAGTWTGSSTYDTWSLKPAPVEADPMLVGDGPAECSSCTALSVLPGVIFDVNGYYRDLGVRPTATRKEMRLAYQAKDGPNSERLTYVFKQLLNPEIRFQYDCTPLGMMFLDEYVRAWLNRRLKDEMSKRMARLAEAGVDLDLVDESSLQRDIASDMGYDVEDEEEESDTPSEVVDDAPNLGKDDDRPAKFDYAYYIWATRPRQDPQHLGLLAEWQRYLVSAFAREGVSIRFAVGFHGKPHRWVQGLIGYRTVFFLNHVTLPTQALADDVARQVRLDRDRTSARQQQHTLATTER